MMSSAGQVDAHVRAAELNNFTCQIFIWFWLFLGVEAGLFRA